jgi:chlorobactene glucosyltransferase
MPMLLTALIAASVVLVGNLILALRVAQLALKSRSVIESREPLEDLPLLSIVVPARNEAHQIEDCVRSLLAQHYPHFEIIVVDDRSDDDTAAIAERLAREDSRVRLIRGDELPRGWVGKPWALVQGRRAARGSWLLFTDADTIHEPLAAASAVRYALDTSVDFLSMFTDQVTVSLAERALLPTILLVIGCGVGPLDEVNNPHTESALFNGQYLLARSEAYDVLGGHDAVRLEIAEDYELAKLVKGDGRFRAILARSNGLVRARMYRGLGELWEGFTKNLSLGVRGQPGVAVLVPICFLLLAPGSEIALAALLLAGLYFAAGACAVGILVSIVTAEFALRRMRFAKGSGLWLPIGLIGMVAIFANSLAKHKRGGVTWRGRTYSPG